MSQLATYLNYFKAIADTHIDLDGHFIEAEIKRIVPASKANTPIFPLLFVEMPSMQITEPSKGMGFRVVSSGAVVILDATVAGDDSSFRAKSDSTCRIAMDVLSKIQKDNLNQAGIIDLSSIRMDAVDPAFIDNCVGWRIEFNIMQSLSICYNPSSWNA